MLKCPFNYIIDENDALFVGLMIAELPRALRSPIARRNWEPIHAFNKSGRHLEFSMNDVIRGKIIHVAKMATKDESSVDVDFAVCSRKKECFYFISRGKFSLCLYGHVIATLKPSCKDIPGSMISRANES